MNLLVIIEDVELILSLGLLTEYRRLGEGRKLVVYLGRSEADQRTQPF
jgi:hypothetical protein